MTRDVSDRAKLCPLCGGKDIYIKVEDFDYPIYTVYIKCAKCGLTGWKNLLHSTPIKKGEEKLIKYWNTRKRECKKKMIASVSYNVGYEAGHKDGFSKGFQDGKEKTIEPQGEWMISQVPGFSSMIIRTCPKCHSFKYIKTETNSNLCPNFCDTCGARLIYGVTNNEIQKL